MTEILLPPPERDKVTAAAEAMDFILDLMLEAETNPGRKAKLGILKQCKKLSHKFAKIAESYADPRNEKVTDEQAIQLLEYLQLVAVGVDNYFASGKGAENE